MRAHLAETGLAFDPGAHAVLTLDRAGRHMSARLVVPDGVTLLPLPPGSPEQNAVENVWQFMRDNRHANRLFRSCDGIVAHRCHARNRLGDRPPEEHLHRHGRMGARVLIDGHWSNTSLCQ